MFCVFLLVGLRFPHGRLAWQMYRGLIRNLEPCAAFLPISWRARLRSSLLPFECDAAADSIGVSGSRAVTCDHVLSRVGPEWVQISESTVLKLLLLPWTCRAAVSGIRVSDPSCAVLLFSRSMRRLPASLTARPLLARSRGHFSPPSPPRSALDPMPLSSLS